MEPQEFDLKYCIGFNEQQLAAVHAAEGPVLLLAVPGSGKTTALITRLGYLILCRNVDPRRILTMTDTVAATGEMRIYAHTILKSYPTVLEHFQSCFSYLCVDESQDTSKLQHEIIRLLVGPRSHSVGAGGHCGDSVFRWPWTAVHCHQRQLPAGDPPPACPPICGLGIINPKASAFAALPAAAKYVILIPERCPLGTE